MIRGISKLYFINAGDSETSESIAEKTKAITLASKASEAICPDDFVAIKLTFGEAKNSGFIKPQWISPLIDIVKEKSGNVYFVETNTLYREARSNSIGHLKVADEHGFNLQSTGIPVIIADGLFGRDSRNVSINKDHFDSVKIASGVYDSDVIIVLSHVTAHFQTGFAGAIKNLGMGCASRAGKLAQHSDVKPEVTQDKCIGCGLCLDCCPANAIALKRKKALIVKEKCIGCGECVIICRWDAIEIKYTETTNRLQEKMAEYALGTLLAAKRRVILMNFLINITKNCDCMAKDEAPVVKDIGILAGFDPVAIDKASIDLVNRTSEGDLFKGLYQQIEYMAQIVHGEKIGLGSQDYELIEIG